MVSAYSLFRMNAVKCIQTCQHCSCDVCCPVVCMCLCFASGCRLSKSWAGASSQPEGQTRKQMDLFGLNPSHATSSSWPSSSNLHVSLQSRKKGAEQGVCVVWGMGCTCNATSTVQKRQKDGQKPERERLCSPCITGLVCAELC